MMDYHERHALFQSHANAVFGGDAAEAHRLQRLIYPDHALSHQVFVFALFTTCVEEHFGTDLDWSALAVFMERLRTTHPDVSALKTEALIRVCFGEDRLYIEVPQCEHNASMWAVCRLIVGEDRPQEDLAALYDRADGFGRDVVRGVFASQQLYDWRGEAQKTGPQKTEPEETEATGTEPAEAGPENTEPAETGTAKEVP